jgi:mono/diheme cytochrome c family protein
MRLKGGERETMRGIVHILKKKGVILAVLIAFLVTLGAAVAPSFAQEEEDPYAKIRPPKATPQDLEAGKAVYFRKCVWCHGPEGAGDGPGADRLWPRPRDFTQGTFKIRHTASGELPLENDLFLTVTHGLPGSAMPPWRGVLSDTERRQVVQFVMNELIVDREVDDVDEEFNVVTVGKPIPSSEESIEKGREVFVKTGKCAECHGEEGRGDGNATQKDEWGFPIMPADLTKCWNFRGNREDPYNPANVFREVSTGLNGTPMPAFDDVLSEEERWHVANFVMSLCPKKDIDPLTQKPKISFVVKSTYVEGELPATIDDLKWEEIEPLYVGLGSQITHKPRNFVRMVDDAWVSSLYNDNEIVFMFAWNDRNESYMDEEAKKIGPKGVKETPPSGDPVARKGITGWPVFNDAIAIEFPAKWQDLTAPVKPRFIFGDKKNAVDLWKWESSGDVKEYTGKGWDDLQYRDNDDLKLVASGFKNGRWRVIMKRALKTDDPENEVQFEPGYYIPTAFFAWDGHNGDASRKMSITTWYYTILEPPVPMKVYLYPPIVALAVIGVQFWLRSKYDVKKRG